MTELPTFGETIRMAMRLDPEIYRAIQIAPNGLQVALFVVVLARTVTKGGETVGTLIDDKYELEVMPMAIGGRTLELYGIMNWDVFVERLQVQGEEYIE